MNPIRENSSNQVATSVFADEDKKCAICLATMKKVVSLTCGHPFDEDCITRVLNGKAECPMCRQRDVVILPTDPKEIQRRAEIMKRTALLQQACDEKRADEPVEEIVEEEVKAEEAPVRGQMDELEQMLLQATNGAREALGQNQNIAEVAVVDRRTGLVIRSLRSFIRNERNANLDDYALQVQRRRRPTCLSSWICNVAIGALAVLAYNYFNSHS